MHHSDDDVSRPCARAEVAPRARSRWRVRVRRAPPRGPHERAHIWCCYGPGTSGGHWSDPEPTGFSYVGLMFPTIRCQASVGSEPVCPNAFSDRELSEM